MSATQRKAELCGIEVTPVARAMPKDAIANPCVVVLGAAGESLTATTRGNGVEAAGRAPLASPQK